MEGTYTRRDLHTEEHTYGGNIYISQTVQMFWIIYLAAYLLDGLGPFAQRKLVNKEATHSLSKI